MKSIAIKLKLASVLAISVLIGIVLYAKADKTIKTQESDRYSIESGPSTNLDATLYAHPRASEYIASSEYIEKIAPETTDATEYLAMYEGDQSNDGGYRRKSVPATTSQAKTNESTVVSNEQTSSGYKVKRVASDYDVAIGNAKAVDAAYEVKSVPQSNQTQGGYAVRSAGDPVSPTASSNSSGGYAIKSAPQGESAEGYAVKSTPQSNKTYGGYAVRSAGVKDITGEPVRATASTSSNEGYAIKRAPQESSEDYAAKSTSGGTSESYGGYAVRSAGSPSSATTAKREVAEGYSKREAPYSSYTGFFDDLQSGKSQQSGGEQLAHYDNAKRSDGAYAIKSAPQSSDETYGGYAVKSVGDKKVSTSSVATSQQYAQDNSKPARTSESEYKGYSIRSAGEKISKSGEIYAGYAVKSAGSADNKNTAEVGYQKRRVPEGQTNIAQYDNASQNDNAYQVKSVSQTSNETYGGYAVRSAGESKTSKRAATNETVGGYAVRSAGGQPTVSRSSSEVTYAVNDMYAGTKIYNNRGQRVGINSPQKDRAVIVMPKRGRSISGVVVQDDPGRSIVIQATNGGQSTFRYGEIDALVNI